MTDRNMGTIRVPRQVFDYHNDRRQAAGLTWAEYLDEESATVTVEADVGGVDVDADVEIDEEAIASAVGDDLLARLPDSLADELQTRLR